MKIKISAWEWMYAFMWCLLLLGATFPCVLLDYDFSFLSESSGDTTMYGMSRAYMFAIVMVIIIHLLDMTHIIITAQITYNKMKRGFINTLISLIVISISLIFVASVDAYYAKISWFILFWIILFIYKISCISMTKKTSVKLHNLILA
jgi:hypothetical protein